MHVFLKLYFYYYLHFDFIFLNNVSTVSVCFKFVGYNVNTSERRHVGN
jgi:hypothetical protein